VKFQAERDGDVYMSQNLIVTVGRLQLSSASEAAVMEQLETMMVSSLDVQLYPEERLRLGAQQESPDRYSYSGANCYGSCVDQGDHLVIKFRLSLNLYGLIKL